MADLLASDEPRRLADFLRENREEILAHWEAEVRKVRAALQLAPGSTRSSGSKSAMTWRKS